MDAVMKAHYEDAKRRGNLCRCGQKAVWECSVCSAPLCEEHGEWVTETCGQSACMFVARQREHGCAA